MSAIAQYAVSQAPKTNPFVSNILVPIDLSDRSADTALFALEFARRSQARTTLLHVEHPPEGDLFRTAEVARWVEERMSNFLPQAAHDLSVRRVVRVDPDISGAILKYAARNEAELIVMSAHRYGTIHRALLGSVTATIVREAPCAVWTTIQKSAEPARNWLRPERILCAAATASEGDEVLAAAARLASHLNARLSIAWTRKVLAEEPEEIERVQSKYFVDSEMVLDSTDIPDALRKAALRQDAGLLIIGRSPLQTRAIRKQDEYEIIRQVPCPVMRL